MKVLTPVKAIRAKCIDCSAGQVVEVRLCPAVACPLYPYRMGHRPKKTGLSDDFTAETVQDRETDTGTDTGENKGV